MLPRCSTFCFSISITAKLFGNWEFSGSVCLYEEKGSALTRADAPREDPGPGGHGGLDQASPKHLLQLGLHLKVLEASVNRYQELGQFQLPVFHHEMQQRVGLGIIGYADILQESMCDAAQYPALGLPPVSQRDKATAPVQARAVWLSVPQVLGPLREPVAKQWKEKLEKLPGLASELQATQSNVKFMFVWKIYLFLEIMK